MTLVPFREREEFKRGRGGEKRVAEALRRSGWHVIPSYDYSGEDEHAPRMEGPQGATYVLPDLDICKGGDRRWAEVKTKTGPCRGRISGELEHGIPLRHLQHYQAVQRESGDPVWLFIYEEADRKLIYRSSTILAPVVSLSAPAWAAWSIGCDASSASSFFQRGPNDHQRAG